MIVISNVVCYDSKGNVLERLYQWDKNQIVRVYGVDLSSTTVFHFCNRLSTSTLVVEPTISDSSFIVDIPNILSQQPETIVVFLYQATGSGGFKTTYSFQIPVIPKPKPDNYYYENNIPEGGDNSYSLPIATSFSLGGVMPVAKTSNMTQPVGVDASGRLYTIPADTEYILPTATPSQLGGVQPIAKTSEMTQQVGIDSYGRLFTAPTVVYSDGEGGGGGYGGGGGGITTDVKTALLNLLRHVGFADDVDGDQYIVALQTALNASTIPSTPTRTLTSITATFSQGSATIYTSTSLDSLRQYLTVRANYSDGTSSNVTTYTLSGTLTTGTSIITVSYGGKTANFTVSVSSSSTPAVTVSSITATLTTNGNPIYNSDSLDTLRQYISVRAYYSNGTNDFVSDYSLSGTLSIGESIITISYGGKTTTVNVTVTADEYLYRLTDVDFTRSKGFTTEAPDYSLTSASGIAYTGFDILLTPGKTYTIEWETTHDTTAEIAGKIYTQSQVANVQSGQDISGGVSDLFNAWIGHSASPRTFTLGANQVCIRIQFRQNGSQALTNDFHIISVKIKEYEETTPVTPSATLSYITPDFTLNGNTIYNTNTLESLKQYLRITAHYSDGTSSIISSGYTLSGTLTVGTSMITVVYGEKTATFTVPVTADTAVYRLSDSDFTRNAWFQTTAPDYHAYSGSGIIYAPFDLLLTPGKSYDIYWETTHDTTAELAGKVYTQSQVTSAQNGQDITGYVKNLGGDTWFGHAESPLRITMGAEDVCIRPQFRQDGSQAITNDFHIIRLWIEEVTE